MDSDARKLHGLAMQAREDGDFVKALELLDQAMIASQKAGDKKEFSEIQATRFLTLRHLWEQTNDKDYLILAKYSALASVEIAKESGDKTALALPFFNLAKVQETLGLFSEAAESYKNAVENITNNPPATDNRAAIVADFKVHMAVCEYRAGDKTALERAEKALQDLEAVPAISDEQYEKQGEKLSYNQEGKFNKDVWASGGHMKISEILRQDDSTRAKQHLQKAKEIIDSNSSLSLRKKQWEKLAADFN